MEANGNEVVGIPLPNLPLFLGENGIDLNGNVIPEAQIIRREVDQNMPCSQRSKSKLAILFCIVETFMSSLFAWIYLVSTDGSAPKTFAWKHLNQFFYISIANSTEGCRIFKKSIPFHRNSGIRPFLNSKDFCVMDKSTTICPYVLKNDYWLSVPMIPLLTFALPIILVLLIVVYVFGTQRITRDTLGKLLCPMYMICIINPLIFLFGWTKQFLQLVIGEGIKSDMLYGYDLMTPPDSISPQWELTQRNTECCGFNTFMDWNITGSKGLYPMSCCNTKEHECTIPPTRHQIWRKGCYADERNEFTFITGITILLLLFKLIVESVFFITVVDSRPAELQETSLVHCRHFSARAFGAMEITDVVTDNRIIVRVLNFRANLHTPHIERTYRFVELYVRSRGTTHGSVNILPINGTLEDIVIHQDQGHLGIFEITTVDNVVAE